MKIPRRTPPAETGEISRRLRALRLAAGFGDEKAFARAAGLTADTVRNVERGKTVPYRHTVTAWFAACQSEAREQAEIWRLQEAADLAQQAAHVWEVRSLRAHQALAAVLGAAPLVEHYPEFLRRRDRERLIEEEHARIWQAGHDGWLVQARDASLFLWQALRRGRLLPHWALQALLRLGENERALGNYHKSVGIFAEARAFALQAEPAVVLPAYHAEMISLHGLCSGEPSLLQPYLSLLKAGATRLPVAVARDELIMALEYETRTMAESAWVAQSFQAFWAVRDAEPNARTVARNAEVAGRYFVQRRDLDQVDRELARARAAWPQMPVNEQVKIVCTEAWRRGREGGFEAARAHLEPIRPYLARGLRDHIRRINQRLTWLGAPASALLLPDGQWSEP